MPKGSPPACSQPSAKMTAISQAAGPLTLTSVSRQEPSGSPSGEHARLPPARGAPRLAVVLAPGPRRPPPGPAVPPAVFLAAGEPPPPVDHQELAVVAEEVVPGRAEERVEEAHVDAAAGRPP